MTEKFNNPREFVIEGAGTAILIFLGCYVCLTADVLSGGIAFALTFIVLVHCFRNQCSCHFNPVITLGMWINGRMDTDKSVFYMLAQVIGATVGALMTLIIIAQVGNSGFEGANIYQSMYGDNMTIFGSLVIEVMIAFLFCFIVLKTTESKDVGPNNVLIPAIALFMFVIIGAVTNSVVNPAKNIGTAIISPLTSNNEPLIDLWLFVLAPVLGAVAAAFLYLFMESGNLAPKHAKPVAAAAEDSEPIVSGESEKNFETSADAPNENRDAPEDSTTEKQTISYGLPETTSSTEPLGASCPEETAENDKKGERPE